jgi:hypothetical protein
MKEQSVTHIAAVYHSTYGHKRRHAEAVWHGAQSVPTVAAQLYTGEEGTARIDELDAAALAASALARTLEQSMKGSAK